MELRKQIKLCIYNSCYKNHPRRHWKLKSPEDCVRNQVDFIISRKWFRNAMKNAKQHQVQTVIVIMYLLFAK